METFEKMRFVSDLAKSIATEMVQKIIEEKIPADWDGHELRSLMAEKFEASAAMSLIRREPRSKRARDYRNAVLANNL